MRIWTQKGHFISNCFLSRIALDGALKIPFRHSDLLVQLAVSPCAGAAASATEMATCSVRACVCKCVDLVNPV